MDILPKGLFVLFFLCFTFLASAQTNEQQSLVELYRGYKKVKTVEEFQQTLQEREKELASAKDAGDSLLAAKLYKEIAFLNLLQFRNIDKSIVYFDRVLRIEDSADLQSDLILTNLGLAEVFEFVEDFERARELVKEAERINLKAGDASMSLIILNKAGEINAASNALDEAIENYDVAIAQSEELGDLRAKANATFNKGLVLSMKNNLPAALDKLREALSIYRDIRDKREEANTLHEIANLYNRMGNVEKALANLVVALEIRKTINDKVGLAASYNQAGGLYFGLENIQRAAENYVLALEVGREAQAREQMQISHEALSRCYRQAGDYKTAFYHLDQSAMLNDLILRDKSERDLLVRKGQFSADKSRQELESLERERQLKEQEAEAAKKENRLLLSLIALSVLVVMLILAFYIQKQRSTRMLRSTNEKIKEQNLQLVELNATKDKFFSIISHDLKGPLNSLTSFSSLLINHTESLTKEEIQLLAKDLDKSLKNLFALLENLLEWSRSQTGNIEFKVEPFDLVTLLKQNHELLKQQASNKEIMLSLNAPEALTIHAHANSINTVVRNLISNAIKFTPRGGHIEISATWRKQQDVLISIADSGVGMPKAVVEKLFRIDTKHSTKGTADEKGTGLGLILCKDFVEKNGGKIWVESQEGKGSTFHFTIPFQTHNKAVSSTTRAIASA